MIQSTDLKLYGIIGHPIGQSLSPAMHNASFDALGIHAIMQAFDIEPASLKDALESFATLGFGGFNVTIPHKQAIIPYLHYIDEEAGIIGAVNTVKFDGKKMSGFNTDFHGFQQTLEPYRSSVDGARFLVLGAGGAARAVTYVLLKSFRTSQIVIASRTTSGSKDLVEHFKRFHGTKLATVTFDDLQFERIVQSSEVIINATPVGMYPKSDQTAIPNSEFNKGQTVIDLIYRPMQTELLNRAAKAGARTISGLEMFIHQGARSFELWTGQRMDIQQIRKVLVQKLEEDASSAGL